jgi:hypothetical protein
MCSTKAKISSSTTRFFKSIKITDNGINDHIDSGARKKLTAKKIKLKRTSFSFLSLVNQDTKAKHIKYE